MAFSIAGIAISALFSFFILAKKEHKKADVLLVITNVLLCIALAVNAVPKEKLTVLIFFIQAVVPYTIFSVFVLFALNVMQTNWLKGWRGALPFLPPLLSGIYFAVNLWGDQYTGAKLIELYDNPSLDYLIIYKVNQLIFIFTLVWFLGRLRQYDDSIRNQFSFTEPIQLNWLRVTTWIYLFVMIASFIVFLISNWQLLPLDIESGYAIVNSFIVLAIFYMSFFGIRHYTIAEYYGRQQTVGLAMPTAEAETEPTAAKEKYRTSSLGPDEEKRIYGRLLALFENKPLYLEAKLQLQEVAEALAVSPHHLSQAINAQSGKPFYDVVNGYRVKHLQKLLADPANKKFTILALGLDSGFNSKASLNRVFKEETGLSPSEYQARYLKQVLS